MNRTIDLDECVSLDALDVDGGYRPDELLEAKDAVHTMLFACYRDSRDNLRGDVVSEVVLDGANYTEAAKKHGCSPERARQLVCGSQRYYTTAVSGVMRPIPRTEREDIQGFRYSPEELAEHEARKRKQEEGRARAREARLEAERLAQTDFVFYREILSARMAWRTRTRYRKTEPDTPVFWATLRAKRPGGGQLMFTESCVAPDKTTAETLLRKTFPGGAYAIELSTFETRPKP